MRIRGRKIAKQIFADLKTDVEKFGDEPITFGRILIMHASKEHEATLVKHHAKSGALRWRHTRRRL